MAKRRLNEKQIAAIAILALPKRGGMTYEQIADEVGVNRDTLNRWRKQDAFNEELKNEIIRRTLDRLPDVMDSVPDHIIRDGNAALFRTLLQAHGMLTEKVEVDTKQGVDTDELRQRIEAMRGEGKSDG